MFEVIGVVLDSSNNKYYFSPNKLNLKKDMKLIVETEQGTQIGVARTDVVEMQKQNLVLPLKQVIRVATESDLRKAVQNDKDALAALSEARKVVKELKLDMTFIEASYTFDRRQLFFSFLADARVDFRELAKKLAHKYKTRIELRQIGVRDKARKIGGLGPCGLFLCCNSFLTDFSSVSINMAKNQFLALNPSKINGICGRLLCCLNYEDETYRELKKNIPNVGMMAETPEGMGKVISVDIFKRTYKVDLKSKGVLEFHCEDLSGSSK